MRTILTPAQIAYIPRKAWMDIFRGRVGHAGEGKVTVDTCNRVYDWGAVKNLTEEQYRIPELVHLWVNRLIPIIDAALLYDDGNPINPAVDFSAEGQVILGYRQDHSRQINALIIRLHGVLYLVNTEGYPRAAFLRRLDPTKMPELPPAPSLFKPNRVIEL